MKGTRSRSGTDEPFAGRDAPPVLILGAGITALGVMRRLARLGIRSFAVTPEPGFLSASRWYNPLSEIADAPPAPGELAGWLARQDLGEAVLIPCSDEAVLEIAALPEEIARRFPSSVPPLGTASTLVDKLAFARLLEAAGIPHPRTVELTSHSDLDGIEDEFLRHAFLKPTQSQSFFRDFNQKALRVRDRADARERIREILDRGHGLVVQEMIEGPAEHQLCVDGFVDRNGDIKTRFARRWLRKYPSDFGESCLAVSVALEDVGDAVEIADHVIGLMPYRGVFSVEFKEGATDGRYRVLEVNARPWWYVGFTCEAGVDVCEMTYRDALEQPVDEVRRYREGVHVVYPELHWQANRLLPAGEREGTLAMLRRWASAVQPIFSWSDPGPWAAGWKKRLQRKLAAAGVRRSIVVPIESSSSEAHGE